MFIYILIIIAVISVGLALWDYSGQKKLKEINKAKKELKRSKVLFHKDSSS